MEMAARCIFLLKGEGLRRYRYRTAALTGRWRASEDAALADAVRAGQAIRSDEDCKIVWKVPGRVESFLYGRGRSPPDP